MKAADVEGNVKWAIERISAGDVTHEEFGPDVVLGDPLPRFGNRDGREIDSGHAQALLRQVA
jgi:hypothetical protein